MKKEKNTERKQNTHKRIANRERKRFDIKKKTTKQSIVITKQHMLLVKN
jgi:hypothetical protein